VRVVRVRRGVDEAVSVRALRDMEVARDIVAVSTEAEREGLDVIRVTLVLDDTPRAVVVPDDLAAALRAEPAVEAFFAALSDSLQRYHLDNIAGAKTDETRQRRVDKAVALFVAGKAR
jgi:uncharacterized protein YdeI (YjbR/CyaY-like superfamily)